MRTQVVKIYSYVVDVLCYSTREGELVDRVMKFKVIARSVKEAEAIACQLSRRAGERGEILASAVLIRCAEGCHELAVPPIG